MSERDPVERAVARVGTLLRQSERWEWGGGEVRRLPGRPGRPRSGELTFREMRALEAEQCPRVPMLAGRVVFFRADSCKYFYGPKWHAVVDGYLLCRNAERAFAGRPTVHGAPPTTPFALCNICVNRARRSRVRELGEMLSRALEGTELTSCFLNQGKV
jgi:hypothetical protein